MRLFSCCDSAVATPHDVALPVEEVCGVFVIFFVFSPSLSV